MRGLWNNSVIHFNTHRAEIDSFEFSVVFFCILSHKALQKVPLATKMFFFKQYIAAEKPLQTPS